jgi:type II secretory pathway component PulF
MPKYSYTAKPQPNRVVQGEIEAASEQEAVSRLTKSGLFPISLSLQEIAPEKKNIFQFRKIPSQDVIAAIRQLATLSEGNVNILNGLNIVSSQTPNKYLRAVLADVVSKVKDGKPLSESLALYPAIFPDLYSAMIRSGEAGGTLDLSLKRLADFLEKEAEFKSSVIEAMTYPAFIFIVGVITVIILIGFVIPRLVTMFEDMGEALPLPTQILIGISDGLRRDWWIILAVVCVCVFAVRRLQRLPQSRLALDRFKLKLAVFGEIILKTDISRLTRTLSLLLSSGMPIVSSLDISSTILQNQVLRDQVLKFKDEISSGSSLSHCLRGVKWFPAFVTNIVAVGEETGTLEKSLLRVAENYEKDVDRTLRTFTRLLEPAIILAIGLVVGFIVLAMLLPIFQINLIVK